MLLLDEIYKSDQEFEALYTKIGVPHNLAQLGVDLTQVEAIALSHGHMDHTGSLYAVLDKIPGTIPLVLHPGGFACG
ncbi:MAG: MBL fold metallo-hydrolase [Pseudomonadota bacterium]